MRYVGAIALFILGILAFPAPDRLTQSAAAWVFAAITVACFFGAYKLLKTGSSTVDSQRAQSDQGK